MELEKKKDKKEISIDQYKDLTPSGSRHGITYGSNEVNIIVTDAFLSFRPILSTIYANI